MTPEEIVARYPGWQLHQHSVWDHDWVAVDETSGDVITGGSLDEVNAKLADRKAAA